MYCLHTTLQQYYLIYLMNMLARPAIKSGKELDSFLCGCRGSMEYIILYILCHLALGQCTILQYVLLRENLKHMYLSKHIFLTFNIVVFNIFFI